jgi:hypothetical protein
MYYNFSSKNLKDGEYDIEKSDKSIQRIQCSSDDQFQFGYLEVWLFAWRDWTELIPAVPRKEVGEKTPVPQKPNPTKWYQLAATAKKCGFRSKEIERILSQDPERKSGRSFLLDARPPEEFEYNQREFESFISQIADMLNSATRRPQKLIKPNLLVHGLGEDLKRRRGRTFNKAYKDDRKYLFLDTLYEPSRGEGNGVSSFLVRSSVYFAFFGRYNNRGSFYPAP